MTTTTEKDRLAALAAHLGVETTEIESVIDREFRFNREGPRAGEEEYLVLTDEEAGERAREYIDDSLWAFKPRFIIRHSKLPVEAEEMVHFFCEKKCEGANDTVRKLIVDMDEFVADAIEVDGRGWFISPYDGKEHEVRVDGQKFFVYRMN